MDSPSLNESPGVPMSSPTPVPMPSSGIVGAAGGSFTLSLQAGQEFRSYPPRDTENYLICPMYSRLTRSYVPKGLEWSPSALIGTSVHRGVVAHYTHSPIPPLQAAREVLEQEFVAQEKYTLEGVWKSVERGVKLGIEAELDAGRKLVCAEEMVYGRRADLVWRMSSGEGLRVTDVKVRLNLDADKLPYAQQEAEHSWQLHDYGYHYGLHFGEPVPWCEMAFIILAPRARVVVHPVATPPQRLAQWYKMAEVIWARKAQDEAMETPPQNWMICESRVFYGQPCPFRGFCHTHKADWSMIDTLCDRRPAREHTAY